MEKFNYYFNTQDRIDSVLNGPINKSTMPSVLFNLIWYAYYNISTEEKEIVKYIDHWMSDKTNAFHLSAYAATIRRHIKHMKDMPWRNIQGTVKVRKSELDYISSFNDIKKEKLLFCYLAVAKFMDMSRPTPSHWEGESDSAIFKMARVSIPVAERDYYINEMINGEPAARIHFAFKNDDLSKRIDYISDDKNDPVVLELNEDNYYELAYTYLNWKNGGGYKRCRSCGRLFRVKGNGSEKNENNSGIQENECLYCHRCITQYEPLYKGKDDMDPDHMPKKDICQRCGEEFYFESYADSRSCYCKDCRKEVHNECERKSYRPVGNKFIVCIDCGKEFEVSSKNTKTIRCEECYTTYRRARKTETMRVLRDSM